MSDGPCWETKYYRYTIADKRGPFISSDRDTNKLVRAQNSFTQEPMLMSDTVTAQRCEIQWEAFEFTAQWIKLLWDVELSNSAQKSLL